MPFTFVEWKRKVSNKNRGFSWAGCWMWALQRRFSVWRRSENVRAVLGTGCFSHVVPKQSELTFITTPIVVDSDYPPQSGASSHTLNLTRHSPFFSFFFNFSIEKVSKITSPVLIIHGTDDEVIDFSHGLALFERCPKAVEPLWVEGAGHNDIELYSQYLERLRRFIGQEVAAHHAWAGSCPSPGDGRSSHTLLDFSCTGGKHSDEGLESDAAEAAPVCWFQSRVV